MGRKAVSYLFHLLAVAFTALLCAAAIMSWRASFHAPAEGNFWSMLAMLLPVILAVNAVALVWWLVRRHWLVALIPLAAILFNLGFISAMIQLPDVGDGSNDAEVRVMTVNANGFRRLPTRAGSVYAISQVAREEQVDILCMQEYHADSKVPTDSIASLLAGRLPYFVSGEGQAIASRYPILDWRYVRFTGTNNDYMYADVKIDNRIVRVFSVHLQTSGIASLTHRFRKSHNQDAPLNTVLDELERNSRQRAGQVEQIRQVIDTTSYPVIVAGDFNDMPSSYTYRRLKGDLTDGFQAVGNGYGGTYRYMGGVLRIDYIFYDHAFEGVHYYMPSEDISDHKAVVAGLRFK